MVYLGLERWCMRLILWTHIKQQHSHYCKKIILFTDVPILTTSISMTKLRGKSIVPEEANNMIEAWRQKFENTYQIPKNDKIKILQWPIWFSECQDAPLKTHNFYVLCFSLGPIINEDQFWRSQDSMKNLYQNHSDHEILLHDQFCIKF